jgi:threonine synthase
VFAAPEGGAVWAGINKLVAAGTIDRDERVVLMNTGTGLKYGELVSVDLPVVDRL